MTLTELSKAWESSARVSGSLIEPSQAWEGLGRLHRSLTEPYQAWWEWEKVQRSLANPSWTWEGLNIVQRSLTEPSEACKGLARVERSLPTPYGVDTLFFMENTGMNLLDQEGLSLDFQSKIQTWVQGEEINREINRDIFQFSEQKMQITIEGPKYIKYILKIKGYIIGEGMGPIYIPATLGPPQTCFLCVVVYCTFSKRMCQSELDK